MTHSPDSDPKLKFKAALEKKNLKHSHSLDRNSAIESSKLQASSGRTPKMFRRKSGS